MMLNETGQRNTNTIYDLTYMWNVCVLKDSFTFPAFSLSFSWAHVFISEMPRTALYIKSVTY